MERRRRQRLENAAARRARVIVPTNFPTVKDLLPPVQVPNIPPPHVYRTKKLASWRRHDRAHHRIVFNRSRRTRYRELYVNVPRVATSFDPFVLAWYRDGDVIRVVDHFNPERKLNKWMNQRMKDWKHHGRSDADHTRAASLRLVNYRNSDYRTGLSGALSHGDPAVVADTALYVANVIGSIR